MPQICILITEKNFYIFYNTIFDLLCPPIAAHISSYLPANCHPIQKYFLFLSRQLPPNFYKITPIGSHTPSPPHPSPPPPAVFYDKNSQKISTHPTPNWSAPKVRLPKKFPNTRIYNHPLL